MIVVKYLFVGCLLAVAYSKFIRQTDEEIAAVEEYIQNQRPEINQRYRLLYHVAGPVGWINDPNGFSFYKDEYHLFYQFYPYDSVWGPMHWGHVSSPDLVNWKQLPVALVPGEEMCFSGSAFTEGDTHVLMYTGRITETETELFHESQYLAFSDDGVRYTKYQGNPVIQDAPNGVPDFRDPKTWKYGDYYYTVIGSTTTDNRGNVLLYRSEDLFTWEFLNVLAESDGTLGYMYECPDFFELDGKFILLMSPQGVEPQGDRFKNIYQTGYIIGSFSYETFEFVEEVEFQEIDFGHDFYAAQTTEHDGKRYLISWFNTWEIEHPEAVDGWAGAMTIVREISLVNNRILMKPVESMTSLREDIALSGAFLANQVAEFENTAELLIEGDLEQRIELLLEGREGGARAWIRWDPAEGKVQIDRDDEDIRQVEWVPTTSRQWRIFLDTSSIELFCGEGEVVFSSRLYPDGGWRVTNLSPQELTIEAYSLMRSVEIDSNSSTRLTTSLGATVLVILSILNYY